MEPKLKVTPQTRLTDILDAYPWLPDALIARDPRFKKIKSPLIQPLIRCATVEMAARQTGYPSEMLISELDKLVRSREA